MLTIMQQRILRNLANGRLPEYGVPRTSYGGMHRSTLPSLARRGLIVKRLGRWTLAGG